MDKEKQKTRGKKRSSQWRKTRAKHLKIHPKCAVCLSIKNLNVHHIIPFNLRPDLENNPKNLITLCEGGKSLECHLIFGHWGNYAKKFNPHIRLDAAIWRKRFKLNTKMSYPHFILKALKV